MLNSMSRANYQHSVRLDAITLRGVASYLRGARLEIKPLTVLSGTNGSGKSAWIKALEILERSFRCGRLPFGFDVNETDSHNIELTNAFLHVANVQDAQGCLSTEDDTQFGPPGTIGLEITVNDDLVPSAQMPHDTAKSEAWNMLWGGRCRAGSKIRLRVAHPTHWDASRIVPHLKHFIEILLDDHHVIRLEGDRDPQQHFRDNSIRPQRSKPYHLSISRSYLTGDRKDSDRVIQLASIYDLETPRFERNEQSLDVDVALLLDRVQGLFCSLVAEVSRAFFHIGAVRELHEELSYDGASVADPAKDRYVGRSGEFAWRMEKRFCLSTMRHIPDAPSFTRHHIGPQFTLIFFDPEARKHEPKLEHLWRHFARAAKRAKIQDVQSLDWSHAEVFAELLNTVLKSRSLFDPSIFGEPIEEDGKPGNGTVRNHFVSDPDIQSLASRGVNRLTENELAQLNYMLVIDAFKFASLTLLTEHHALFSEYLSRWLTILLDTGLITAMNAISGGGSRHNQWSLGLSQLTIRLGRPTMFMAYSGPDLAELNEMHFSRLQHACFGCGLLSALQPPRQLSAGFHQVFPMIVQLALMRPDELVAIENPEVHLHPALQLKLAKMLIEHAKSGRRILIETHSDLIIRRVIRAILEEELGQSQVQIYFTALDQRNVAHEGNVEVEFLSSSLQPVRVDDKGRIANWPEGFLDEDVRESQRLMDVMYGHDGEEDDDDDE